MAAEALLLSIRPRFAAKILDGTKTVELRRVRPKVVAGAVVLIYESAPVMALVGFGEVDRVITASPNSLWPHVKNEAGVTRREFDAYFNNASCAVAIGLRTIGRLRRPLPLTELRDRWPWFRPPQSFCYLRAAVDPVKCRVGSLTARRVG